MGTDLEDTLDALKEFKSQCDYWLSCISVQSDELQEKLRDVEQTLREIEEKRK